MALKYKVVMYNMNIQIYFSKNSFDVQKVRRYLKERRVPFTEVELSRHKPGLRELKLFAQAAGGVKNLVDMNAKGERADYIKQLSIEDILLDELMAHPEVLRCPIVRNGQKVVIGFDEKVLAAWISNG